MRLVLVVLLLPVAGATDLSFHTPFQVDGDTTAQGAWALLVFAPGGAVHGTVEAVDAEYRNHSLVRATADVHWPQTVAYRDHAQVPADPEHLGDFAARLETAGWASVFVVADHVTAIASGEAQVEVARRGEHPSAGDGSLQWSYRLELEVPEDGPAAAWGGGVFSLEAEGLRVLEYHEVALSCRSRSCPPSAVGDSHAGGIGVAEASAQTLHYVEVLARGGRMQVAGDAFALVLGGPSIDLDVLGVARLPQAHRDGVALGGTVTLEGRIVLAGLREVEADRVVASLSGDYSGVWIDEQPADPAAFGGWTGAATAAAVAVGLWVAWVLGLRIRRPKDLGQNAKALLRCIQANPGLHSLELARLSGLSRTSVRHHLGVLERVGSIVRHCVGRTWYVYENHGRYGVQDQAIIALTRDVRARAMLLRLSRRPATQQEMLQYAGVFDVPRSTAQECLTRLVKAGSIRTWREDGHRWYAL